MKKTLLTICALAGLGMASPAAVHAANVIGAESQRSVTALPSTSDREPVATRTRDANTASYAAREKAAPQTAQFKGGDGAGIYIGGSTLAVVLLVVLIVILI